MRRWPYRIYAAPRDPDGVYRAHETKTLFVQGFKREEAREIYWMKRIVPNTTKEPGADYEYVMCDVQERGEWEFVSERRYSNARLIKGNVGRF